MKGKNQQSNPDNQDFFERFNDEIDQRMNEHFEESKRLKEESKKPYRYVGYNDDTFSGTLFEPPIDDSSLI